MRDSLSDLQAEAIAFRDARDWAQFHAPKDLMLGLVSEVGELGELLLWKSPKEIRAYLASDEGARRMGEELSDVLIYLLYLAEAAGVDLAGACRAKIEANGEKYPVDRARGSATKYTDL